ncbi:WXG100 family type VII secretion target [Actinacidiphila glaucinigra]|uniref:WXG100 family type VII secretion target n=1 Tax=Actinacidiphila glaucinigra TaxID=235986 RepID=UPI003798F071
MVSIPYLDKADLGPLADAAASWGALPAKYDALQREFEQRVINHLKGHWEGDAATAAFATMSRARTEYENAATEAGRIAKLLADAHTEFAAFQKQLHALLDEARADSFHVAEDGAIKDVDSRWDSPTASASPGFATERKEKLDSLSSRLTRVLELATAADEAASAALGRDANGESRSFNTSVYTSLDAVEADQAAALMTKKGRLSDAELTKLDLLLSANKNDPEFSRQFAVRTGAENMLDKYNEIVTPPAGTHLSKGELARLKDIQRNLGTTIGTATTSDDRAGHRDPAITKFQDDLLEAGHRDFNANPTETPYGLSGYQLTSSLMSHGTWDTEFLQAYGNDLLTAEKNGTNGGQNPDAYWTGNMTRSLGPANIGALDPMTGFMDALGHNPAASTEFLSSESEVNGEKVDHLDYLMKDRHWPDGAAFTGDSQNRSGYNNLGHALESATTGHPYDTSPSADTPAHNEKQARLMEEVVHSVSQDSELAHDGMQDSLGRMAGEYMPDIHQSLTNDRSGNREQFYPIEGTAANLSEQDTSRFLMTVGKDPDGYAAINLAESAYTSNLIDYHLQHPEAFDGSTDTALREIARSSGEVQGSIAIGRRESDIGDAAEADKAYNDAMGRAGSYASGIVGTGIGVGTSFIATPAVGAGVGGVATTVTGDLINQIVSGAEGDTMGNAVYSSGTDWEDAKYSTSAVLQDAYRNSAEAQGQGHVADYQNILANEVEVGFHSADSNLDGYGQDKRGTGQG